MPIKYIYRAIILNIYIYGTPSFKKEIHKTLIDSNIKLKLGANNLIKEIESLSALKEIINENPKEIFLIDDSKIIKKNSFSKKVKFLTPKDAIEEEFLLNSGISDLSVDSLEEIPKYILKKFEQENISKNQIEHEPKSDTNLDSIDLTIDEDNFLINSNENLSSEVSDSQTTNENSLDDELSKLLIKNPDEPNSQEIDSSISDLENLFSNDDNLSDENNNLDFENNFGLNNISYDYDDSSIVNDTSSVIEDDQLLNDLMNIPNDETFETEFKDSIEENVTESFNDLNFLDSILNEKEEENNIIPNDLKNEELVVNEPNASSKSIELDNLFNKIKETKIEEKESKEEKTVEILEEPIKGVKMQNDEFSELDLISEKDLIEALNQNGINNQSTLQTTSKNSVEVVGNNEVVNISSSNVDELAKLFSKILNNKTLEITIKIKD